MIVALNNKSNLDKEAFLTYQEELRKIKTNIKLILCPTFLNINLFQLENFSLGAQNVSKANPGAFTGEIAAEDLKKSNVKYTIIGHSERREYQKESNEEIQEKMKRLIENDIIPILCIGETKKEREEAKVEEVLKKELEVATKDLTKEQKKKIIIAYEPIWSIGTGIVPTNEEIQKVFQFIKRSFPDTKVLYGGSANEKNIDTIKKVTEIDGYLLGGLSLKPNNLQIFLEKLEN